jgi:hypothetical protein
MTQIMLDFQDEQYSLGTYCASKCVIAIADHK